MNGRKTHRKLSSLFGSRSWCKEPFLGGKRECGWLESHFPSRNRKNPRGKILNVYSDLRFSFVNQDRRNEFWNLGSRFQEKILENGGERFWKRVLKARGRETVLCSMQAKRRQQRLKQYIIFSGRENLTTSCIPYSTFWGISCLPSVAMSSPKRHTLKENKKEIIQHESGKREQ